VHEDYKSLGEKYFVKMNEDWDSHCSQEQLKNDEPWHNPDFNLLSRSQQNTEIYKVVASAVLSIQAEIVSSRARLRHVLARLEVAESERRIRDQIRLGDSASCNNFNNNDDIPETFSNDENLDAADPEGLDCHSLPPDWAGGAPEYSPPASLSPDLEFLPEPEPDPATIAHHKLQHPKVIINVGGVKHEVMWRMLEKRPLTRLGMLAKAKTHDDILNLVDAYSLTKNEIYFDRDPTTFNCVLNFYRTDRLHVLDEICILDFADDLDFWKIKELNLEVCCIDKFNARREHIIAEVEKDRHLQAVEEVEEDFGDGYFAPYQRALWDLFEKPQSSWPAKFISILSILMVLVSTVGMCLNTFTWIQKQDVNGDPVDNPYLGMIEAVCISYFSVEFLLRLAGSPDKLAFLKGTMNVVDCLAIAPYYLTLFFFPDPEIQVSTSTTVQDIYSTVIPENEEVEEESGFGDVGRIMQVFRIARIMRIFKLARRSVGLQSIAHTVRTSWKDLGLLFMLVGMGMLVFGSLEYYIENAEPGTGFTSIPQGMWWAVQTLTSLGYGDFWPHTILGKIVGSICAICGVLVMALPIPIVVDNFADYYSEQKKLEKKELKRQAQAKQAEFDTKAEGVVNKRLIHTLANTPGPFSSPPTSPDDAKFRVKQNGTHK